MASAFIVLTAGCGGSPCDDARKHVDDCGANTKVTVNDTNDCSGASACAADCINNASCDDLNTNPLTAKWSACAVKCQ